MISTDIKQRIVVALLEARKNFVGSDARYAVSLDINAAQYNRIKNGETDKIISDQKWIGLARRLAVNLDNAPVWKTAQTPVFQFITAQLEACQGQAISSLLCDLSDIGKTYTCEHYVRSHKNAVYIDCSQAKTKQLLIRSIAREFGLTYSGRYNDVYADLVFYLKTLSHPLIILDEVGDVRHETFLEIKSLWNATRGCCAWYMVGADGLKQRIQRSIDNKIIGFTELFSRFGKRYQCIVPENQPVERTNMLIDTASMIIAANAQAGVNKGKVLRGCMGEDTFPSLRRIYNELTLR